MNMIANISLLMSIAVLLLNPIHAQALDTSTSPDTWQQLSPTLRIGGSARYRYESKQDFQFGAPTAGNTQDYWLQQLRLHMLWQASSHVSLFIEGQDARIFQGFHGHVIDKQKTPNILKIISTSTKPTLMSPHITSRNIRVCVSVGRN